MKLSNLRLEHNYPYRYGKPQARVVCDMEAGFTPVKEFYFCVDEEYADWLTTESYDAFLVAALYPAMYFHENLEIDGPVSKKLLRNINHYIQAIIKDYEPKSDYIEITASKEAPPNFLHDSKQHVGTGFSGGVDSFSTLHDNFFSETDPDYKVDTLFFFHVGQYGHGYNNPKTWERAINRFQITKDFANEVGLNSIFMNTNMFEFYLPVWEYDAGVFCRIASVLVFQKVLKRYYISNGVSYAELRRMNFEDHHVDLAEYTDPILMPLLSPEGCDIICDGAQYLRTEKISRIAKLPIVQKHLNVCVNASDNCVTATNCSLCPKCLRTLMTIESAGMLDQFSGVFNLDEWRKHSFGYKCMQVARYHTDLFAQDNVDYARKMGSPLPSCIVANLYMKALWLRRLPGRLKRKIIGILSVK